MRNSQSHGKRSQFRERQQVEKSLVDKFRALGLHFHPDKLREFFGGGEFAWLFRLQLG